MLLGHRRDVVERRGRLAALGGGHETEVARGHVHRRVPRQHAPDGDADRLDGSSSLLAVARGTRLVEDDPDDGESRVDRRHAVHGRGDRARGRGDVDDEHDGRPRQGRHVGAGGEALRPEPTVHEPHDALEHRDVGGARVRRAPCEQGSDPLLADEPRVEGPARSPRRQGVVAGVDVVGADLGRGDGEAASGQRRHDPDGDRRLAVPRGRGRDEHPREVYHSMPFWPFCPLSKGWAIFVISVATSAISRRRGCGSRPVMITCW